MRGFPDEYIDLTVTSPPYDNLRDYHGYNFDYEATFRELYRVTKRGGVCVWIVSDQTVDGSETGTSFRQALYAKECGFNLHDTMIWQKISSFHSPVRYIPDFEYMFVLSKGKPKTIHLIRDRVNKFAGTKIHGRERNRDGTQRIPKPGKIVGDYSARVNVWDIHGDNKTRTGHPAVFPVRLVQDHIISWSNEGDTVLDPLMGSGTTGVACLNTNRNFIGIDIDKEYCDIARRRIDQAKAELYEIQ